MSNDPNALADARSAAPALAAIADGFVGARRQGRALPGFPGEVPDDLVTAYRVQDLAIASGPTPRRVERWAYRTGTARHIRRRAPARPDLRAPAAVGYRGQPTFEVFSGGFGAVEAEYVLRLEADVPADKTDWTPAEAAAVPSTLFIGMEVASSPLATNELARVWWSRTSATTMA